MAVLLEYESDKLNGQTIYYYDGQEYVPEPFVVYTWVHYGVFVVRLSLPFHISHHHRLASPS